MRLPQNNFTKTSQVENYEINILSQNGNNEITLEPESTTNTVVIPKLKLDPSGNTLTLDRTKLNTTPTKSDKIFVGPATTTGTNTGSTTQSDEIFNRTATTTSTNTAETASASFSSSSTLSLDDLIQEQDSWNVSPKVPIAFTESKTIAEKIETHEGQRDPHRCA